MTISTIVVLVLALVLIGVGLYLIYTKIYQPSEATGSILTCESRGGTPTAIPGCTNLQPCSLCIKLRTEASSEFSYCCIKELT